MQARSEHEQLRAERDAAAHLLERSLSASDDCIAVLDVRGSLLSINLSGQRALGIEDFAPVAGTVWLDFWSPEDRPAAECAVSAARAGARGRFTGFLGHEGPKRWWDVALSPIPGPDGSAERLLAIARDVTDSVLALHSLAQSEERYRLLSETLPGVTWSATPDGLLDHVGGEPDEANRLPSTSTHLGNEWLDIVHPDDAQRVAATWRRSIETGVPYDVQFRVRMASGAYRWQLVRAQPQRDERGAIARWVGVNIDIDDQRRADETREKFVRLVEASDDLIAIMDLNERVTFVNEAGRRLAGIGPAETERAATLSGYFTPEDAEFARSEIMPAVLRDGRWTGEFRLRHFQSGEPVPIFCNVFPLLDETGSPVAFATVSRDLRGRRRLEVGMRALAETGAAMYGSLDFLGTVRNVAQAVARSFASFCIVDALDAGGVIRTVTASHRDPGALSLLERAASARTSYSDHPIARAIYHGESTLMASLPQNWFDVIGARSMVGDEIDRLDIRSAIFVPIRSSQEGQIYGALTCTLDGRDPREFYNAEDLRFAEEIASRAGLALDHARAYERERRIAVTLQEASLPRVLPSVENLHLSAEYRPGDSEATIGGDWYDAFVLGDGRVVITIGDVLGHGLGAAVTMGKVRQAMQSVAMLFPDPNAMLTAANATLQAQSGETYATALAGIFDPVTYEFTFASAGHPGPILRHSDGTLEELSSFGLMLGLGPEDVNSTTRFALRPGAALIFYTDGIIEATRDSDEGYRRLRAAVASDDSPAGPNPAYEIVERVLDGQTASDDIAVLVAEIGPGPRFHALRHAAHTPAAASDFATLRDEARAPIVENQGGKTIITLPARFAEIATARQAIRTLLSSRETPEDAVVIAELAAGELVGNAIDHGSGDIVDVSIRLLAGAAILAVTNQGPSFARRAVDLQSLGLDERGRGLALLRALGCEIEITAPSANRCTVTATIPFHLRFGERSG